MGDCEGFSLKKEEEDDVLTKKERKRDMRLTIVLIIHLIK